MTALLKFGRLGAALSALLLLTACGMLESLSPTPGDSAGKTSPAAAQTAPARPAAAATGLPGQPAQCAKEGESCGARGASCCGGLVCAGIRNSFCLSNY